MTTAIEEARVFDHVAELEGLEQILRDAAKARGSDYQQYETFKREITALNLTPDEYQQAIHRLTEVLGI